jgi:hypothetical protein
VIRDKKITVLASQDLVSHKLRLFAVMRSEMTQDKEANIVTRYQATAGEVEVK